MRRYVVGLAIVTVAALALSWAHADAPSTAQKIAQQISSQLQQEKSRGHLQDLDIDLEVEGDTVWLFGRVSSSHERELVVELARAVPGVERVVSDLTVHTAQAARQAPTAQPVRKRPVGLLAGLEGALDKMFGTAQAKPDVKPVGHEEPLQPSQQQPEPMHPLGPEPVVELEPLLEPEPDATPELGAEPLVETQPTATDEDQQVMQQIAQKLKQAKRDGSLRGFGIQLNVQDGTVWMEGQVATSQQHQLALELARRTAGVHQVVNRLTITSPDPPAQPESEENVPAAELPAAELLVNAQSLQAEVPSPAPPVAEPAAQSATDQQLARQILKQLEQQKAQDNLHNYGIDLTVNGGQVVLDGYVAAPEQHQLVLELARQTPGVDQVVNRLAIRAPEAPARPEPVENVPAEDIAAADIAAADIAAADVPGGGKGLLPKGLLPQGLLIKAPSPAPPVAAPATDQQLAMQIVQQLEQQKAQGKLRNYRIDLAVQNGDVVLVGQVSTAEQQQLVLELARRVRGVQQVVNQLAIVSPEDPAGPTPATESPVVPTSPDDLPERTRTMLAKPAPTAPPAAQPSLAARTARSVLQPPMAVGVASKADTAEEAPEEEPAEPSRDADVPRKASSAWIAASRPPNTAVQVPAELEGTTDKIQPVLPRPEAVEPDKVAQPEKAAEQQDVERSEEPLGRGHEILADYSDSTEPADAAERGGRVATTELVDDSETDDEQISRELVRRLQWQKESGHLREFGIRFKVHNGDVWIKGRVASRDQQQLALQAARTIPGVHQVVNDLIVIATEPSGASLSDDRQWNPQEPVAVAKAQAVQQPAAPREPAPLEDAASPVPQIALPTPQDLAAASQVPGQFHPAAGGGMPYDPRLAGYGPGMSPYGPVPMGYGPGAPHYGPPAGQPTPGAGSQVPLAFASAHGAAHHAGPALPVPAHLPSAPGGAAPIRYDHPHLPGYSWPTYAAYPNYAGVTYPKQYSPSAWPYIGPFYPYPQVPLGWRKVQLQWEDGWWFLDFKSK